MAKLREWAVSRRTAVGASAVEMIWFCLHAVREQGQKLPAGLDVTDKARGIDLLFLAVVAAHAMTVLIVAGVINRDVVHQP